MMHGQKNIILWKSGLVTPCLDCGQLMDCFTHGCKSLNSIK